MAAITTACAATVVAAVSTSVPVAVALAAGFVGMVALVTDRRRSAAVLWGAVALAAPFQGLRPAPFLTLSDIVMVLAVIATLPDTLTRRRSRVAPPPLVAALVLLVAGGLLGTFFSASPGASLLNMVKLVVAAGGSVLALSLWSPEIRSLRRFAWLWFGGAVANTMIALFASKLVLGRAQGLTTQPNHLGLIGVLGTALGLGLVLSASKARFRTVALAGTGVCVAGVVASGSRAALIGEVATFLAVAIFARRPRLLTRTAVVVILLGIAAGAGLIRIPDSSALSRLAGGGGSRESNVERQRNLATTMGRIARHPLTGEGFEFALEPHDIYLQPLVVAGPIGLVALAMAAWAILRASRAGLGAASSAGDGNGFLLAGLSGGYVGYLAAGFFQNIAWDRYLWIYIGLVLMVAASLRESYRPELANRTITATRFPPGPARQISAA